ncbi:hypothetical protein SUGI_1119910 [Cryptomeria japonica]|nr:hypothetical protein SUGI_1119910 [Cryptomeria japonica]
MVKIQNKDEYSIRQFCAKEQMVMLAKQISAYGSICKQLIEMHSTIVVQQNVLHGFTPGQALTFNSVMGFVGHKMTTRQRWTPSQAQLQILEKIFEKGKGTPCKQRIKEITAQLSQHGHISETNVYNWFQNRRARTKRKHQTGLTGSGEYEMDNLVDSSNEKKAKFDESSGQETSLTRQSSASFQNHGASEYNNFDSQRHKSSTSFGSQVASKATVGFNRSASFEHGLSVTNNELQSLKIKLTNSMESIETSNSLHAGEGYAMIG